MNASFISLFSRKIDTMTEVPLPVKFLFVLIGPAMEEYLEIGRSLSTLLSTSVSTKIWSENEDHWNCIRSFLSRISEKSPIKRWIDVTYWAGLTISSLIPLCYLPGILIKSFCCRLSTRRKWKTMFWNEGRPDEQTKTPIEETPSNSKQDLRNVTIHRISVFFRITSLLFSYFLATRLLLSKRETFASRWEKNEHGWFSSNIFVIARTSGRRSLSPQWFRLRRGLSGNAPSLRLFQIRFFGRLFTSLCS